MLFLVWFSAQTSQDPGLKVALMSNLSHPTFSFGIFLARSILERFRSRMPLGFLERTCISSYGIAHVSAVDFRHSGKLRIDHGLVVSRKMARWAIPWAMKGSRKECAAILPASLVSESLATVSRVREAQ